MKIHELDTKEVTLYILNDKVFELDRCPTGLSMQL